MLSFYLHIRIRFHVGLPQSISSVQTPVTSSPSSVFPPSQNVQTPSTCSSGGIVVPDHWRPEVESCIASKHLTDNARAEIKRTLVTSEWNSKYVPAIITYGQQNGKKAINSVANDVDMAGMTSYLFVLTGADCIVIYSTDDFRNSTADIRQVFCL